jgi:hypothetical protein
MSATTLPGGESGAHADAAAIQQAGARRRAEPRSDRVVSVPVVGANGTGAVGPWSGG